MEGAGLPSRFESLVVEFLEGAGHGFSGFSVKFEFS